MPELPDVEVFKNYFNQTSLHQEIDDVELRDHDLLTEVSPATLRRHLRGHEFEATESDRQRSIERIERAALRGIKSAREAARVSHHRSEPDRSEPGAGAAEDLPAGE